MNPALSVTTITSGMDSILRLFILSFRERAGVRVVLKP
jgi:hypothetical protein